jgi:hypothetical protein
MVPSDQRDQRLAQKELSSLQLDGKPAIRRSACDISRCCQVSEMRTFAQVESRRLEISEL